jgi:hypothetical protein
MIAATTFAGACIAAFDRVIPAAVRADPREWRAARQLALLAAISALSVPLLTMMYHLLGDDSAGMVVLTAGIVMMIAPFAMNAGLGLAVARDMFIGALFLLKIWLALHLGGLAAPTNPWFLLCPLIAVLLGGLRPALAWGALVMAAVGGIFVVEQSTAALVAFPVNNPAVLQLVSLIGLVALSTIIALLFNANFDPSPGRRKKD